MVYETPFLWFPQLTTIIAYILGGVTVAIIIPISIKVGVGRKNWGSVGVGAMCGHCTKMEGTRAFAVSPRTPCWCYQPPPPPPLN